MKILSYLKRIDSFGNKIEFSINNNSTFQTVSGGFLTILILYLYFFFFYFFGLDLFYKKNPNVYSQIKPINDKGSIPKIILNSTEFIFGIRLEDIYANKIDMENYVYPVVYQSRYFFNKTINNFQYKRTYIDSVSCE